MSLAILFHFLCAQHVSDIHISTIRSLRLFCWITTLVRCVLEFRCGWVGVVSVLKNKRPIWCHLLFYFTSYVLNMFRTFIQPPSGACDYSVELPHWFDVCWNFGVVGLEWYPCCRLKLYCSLQHGYHSNVAWSELVCASRVVGRDWCIYIYFFWFCVIVC